MNLFRRIFESKKVSNSNSNPSNYKSGNYGRQDMVLSGPSLMYESKPNIKGLNLSYGGASEPQMMDSFLKKCTKIY